MNLKSASTAFSTNPRIIFVFLCLCYLIMASLQSLVSHYQFFTNAWDLGFHNQLMFKFAHLRQPSSTLWNPQYELKNCFGDHFTLLMPLNSQLYWIFGSYGLLVAQMIYVLIGALGIYNIIEYKCKNSHLALFAVVLFFTHYSLYAALVYDAHDNVYGMMFLPWILYFYYKENFKGFLASLLFFLIARDDLALTSILMGLSFMIFDRKKKLRYGLSCSLISLIYFLVIYKLIMPALSSVPWGYNAWRFNHIGKSIPEVIINSITHPFKTLSMFTDKVEKRDKLFYFLMTGGIFVLVQPRFLFIFIPTFITTCLSDAWTLWGNMYHYNIVFAAVLPILTISTATMIKNSLLRNTLLIIALCANIYTLKNNYFHDWSRFGRIFTKEYYHRRDNLNEIREGLAIIPSVSSVSATNYLTPHLAFRDKAYFFPDVKDAEYIAINEADTAGNYFPFTSKETFKNSVEKLRKDTIYTLLFEKRGMLVFRKKTP